jgi:hypothetical protein
VQRYVVMRDPGTEPVTGTVVEALDVHVSAGGRGSPMVHGLQGNRGPDSVHLRVAGEP